MNGLELLARLGIPEALVRNPEHWMSKTSDKAFDDLLNMPLKSILISNQNNLAIPLLDGRTGILKGSALFEVQSYRNVSAPLPLAKSLESTGEEATPQFTASRTLKLLLTDGSDRTFVAMEYETCQQLNDIRLNCKIQLNNCYYHRGVLLLTPETFKLVGCPTRAWSEPAPSIIDDVGIEILDD